MNAILKAHLIRGTHIYGVNVIVRSELVGRCIFTAFMAAEESMPL